MQGNILLLIAALFPMLMAPVGWLAGRRSNRAAIGVMIGTCLLTLAYLVRVLVSAAGGAQATLTLEGFCGLGLRMRADGFRALYACVAGVMWLMTSVFSLDYLAHEENVGRYTLFTLITFGAVVGIFLSDTLYSVFLFFEVMSLASYPWVAHEENPEAMRAAETYLYIAVIGGLVMLMGLFLLPNGLATTSLGELAQGAQEVGTGALWLPATLMLFGFGAKAGSFPLHIWLPKAHPVAPAPASALLSGLLTKAGVFGMLILTCGLMRGEPRWGDLIFRLGVITMALGAVMAVFSVNLKRTLACSSLSQIGFIMIGTGLCGMMGEENGLAAFGTVQHMLNHSLFKLVLFLCAGVVAMNAHALNLNDVRGYGRRKPALHFAFLLGMLGIGGVPALSGYISKSMLHEGLLEYIAMVREGGGSALPYEIGEWLFVISGGVTLCYMLKLYICLFWRKHPTRQAEFDANKKYLTPAPKLGLCLCAAIIPALGLLPGVLMTGAGRLSLPFLGAEAPALPIAYFSAENLLGAAKSIVIGLGLYALIRFTLMRRAADGSVEYLDRWPKQLDLENAVYRPLLSLLARAGYGFAWACDKLMDWLSAGLCKVGYGAAWLCDKLMDWLSAGLVQLGFLTARTLDISPDLANLAASKTLLAPRVAASPAPVGNRFTYAIGTLFDRVSDALARATHREKRAQTSYAALLAAGGEEASKQFRQLTRSISFGLLMFCVGLCVTLMYLLL